MNDYIQQFINAAHRAGQAHLMICSSGNMSWKIADDKVLMSATGSWLPQLSEKNVAVLDLQSGESLNNVKPSMEHVFHLNVLRQRPDVKVVLHFQSVYATALACIKNKSFNFNVTAEIPCHIGSEIPIVPYYRPGSVELAQAVTEALTNHDACLLASHGQVVCGNSLDDTYEKACFFEMAARIMIHTQGHYDTLSKQDIEDLQYYVLGKK